jgi:hypothetical protein
MSALLTAGFGEPRNGSLTTAARSCVRGAARATVDKSPCSDLRNSATEQAEKCT